MHHIGTQTLHTQRLILRRHRESDAEDMFARWTGDPAASRFWTWQPHASVRQTRAIVQSWLPLYDSPAYYHWLIADRRDDRPIGYIYLDDIADTSASVHYLIARSFQNQGLATEACTRIVRFAYESLGAQSLHSRHHILNPASGRVLQKCGFLRTHSDATYHYYTQQKR